MHLTGSRIDDIIGTMAAHITNTVFKPPVKATGGHGYIESSRVPPGALFILPGGAMRTSPRSRRRPGVDTVQVWTADA